MNPRRHGRRSYALQSNPAGVSTSWGSRIFASHPEKRTGLGANDQKHLESVSLDSKVTVLRLNSLTDSDITDILNARSDIGDAQAFIALAQERRVYELLKESQTLKRLADVVAQGRGWPDSRKKTFDMACRQMIREHNEEHQAAQESNSPPTPDQLLDDAGRLCAVQLISGAAGYTLRGQADEEYPARTSATTIPSKRSGLHSPRSCSKAYPITALLRSIATSPKSSALGTSPESSKEVSRPGA